MNRPKRKKSKDNPYTLLVINNKYYVEFKDVKNILNTVEVTEEQFEAFNEFELEDKSQMNKDERHKERSEVYEETLYKRANLIYDSVEDDFIKKSRYEDLMKAINELPKTIKRRIKMFYFEELTTSQIATLEHCSDRMIRKSLEQGRNKIKCYFEKNKLI